MHTQIEICTVLSEEVYCAAVVLLGGKREHFCWCFCCSLIVFGDFGFWGLGKILFLWGGLEMDRCLGFGL